MLTSHMELRSYHIESCSHSHEFAQLVLPGLLKYLISFRNHNEFHEQCIERIFLDIMQRCKPEKLTVYGRYTRRGGLDINPYRSTEKKLRAKV